MQLKGLVRFFALALILICLYQLSFTWIVRSYESSMRGKAELWVKAMYPKTADKDSLDLLKKQRLQHILDSTKDTKIGPFGFTTYRTAKEKELMLGLDLQGGMSVTMEVGLDGLIKSLANYTKDATFNKALDAAVAEKATSGADLITLFYNEFKNVSAGAKLAPYFVTRSNGKINYDASNDAVITYLRDQAKSAFTNTTNILTTRIDRFGVASPNINPDPQKGIINIELAGINDPERVRHYLQSTANLQFFEVYNINDVGESILSAEKSLADYLKGTNATDSVKLTAADTAKAAVDTAKKNTAAAGQADTNTIAGFSNAQTSNPATGATVSGSNKVDSLALMRKEMPLRAIVQFTQPQQDKSTGKVQYPANIGYVAIADTATLNNYLSLDVVKSKFSANLKFVYGKPENASTDAAAKNFVVLYAIKTLDNGTAELEGEHVSDARADYDERGRPAIKMNMDPTGTRIWAKMTERNSPQKNGGVSKPIAIVLDNIVYSAPFVNGPIPNGSSEISGNFSVNEAQDLADILKSGKLPAPAKIVAEQQVGPTLGQDAVNGGLMSFAISFIVIFALMLIYYNTAGWVANIALILNLLFTIGILSALGFTLTAPGIAALVLTVGLAVDTNVIIFERIKEELTKGKSYILAVHDGYRRSYAPVIDAHVTTLLTAIILFIFGLGPILGFATTQILGILLSLFCGILISRLITDFYTNKQRHFKYFTGISNKVFKHTEFKFTRYRKIAYGISVVVLLLGAGSFFNGFDEGVEFKGGRSYTIKFDKAYNTTEVADALKAVFDDYPVIKTVGTPEQLNITTAYLINQAGQDVDSTVERTLYTGLQKFLPAGTSYNTFQNTYKQASQKVLPSISDDLKSGAQKATIISIIIICLYIFIRFRDWRFSLGTIVALLHDVFVTLAVFSFLKGLMPFPLEIDQHFIAAILTVIGFSMNDTVIVYDRIREDSKLMKGESKEQIINRAINQTLSRTIMTSLTVFLTILILFIFGGEVTRGFAFAMLIGVITGTYSSIFVAAPILIDFAKDKPLGITGEVKKAEVKRTEAKKA
ncbi:protein translocase subunit SecDF [Parafilimonas sp.]|uniref:protein translocase subunit SecDF n=1 Tax=Parafilimonas sp. TaxID=1969739 RepID=UPI0039E21E9D